MVFGGGGGDQGGGAAAVEASAGILSEITVALCFAPAGDFSMAVEAAGLTRLHTLVLPPTPPLAAVGVAEVREELL